MRDLLALIPRTVEVFRRGWLAGLLSTGFLGVAALMLVGVASTLSVAIASSLGRRDYVVLAGLPTLLAACFAAALTQAGGLAAFGLAAVNVTARTDTALSRGLSKSPSLAVLVLLFFVAPILPLLPARPVDSGILLPLLPLVAYAHVRWLTLAQVVVAVEDGHSSLSALRRAHELGRGRFAVLLAATLAPFLIAAAVGPSELGLKTLGVGSRTRRGFRELTLLAGVAGCLYVRPAFAAAAYGVAVAPAPKEDL